MDDDALAATVAPDDVVSGLEATSAAATDDPALARTGAVSGPSAAASPTRLGRYTVLERLGEGGMGVVVAAYDPDLDRRVAIKLLRAGAAAVTASTGRSEGQERMLREARAMARVAHPNVITVHEVGTFDGQAFIAMEYAGGGSLGRWCKAAPRTPRELIAKFIDAGRGLQAAHAAGMVHRDFKPENVLLTADAIVRVADFGLVGSVASPSRATGGDDDGIELTQEGALLGTPAYMAPEQHAGQPAGPAADQFSFCVSLWEALYGRRPFAGKTLVELSLAVQTGKREPAPTGVDVPARVHAALDRGLAVEPGDRWPDMAALLAALDEPIRRSGRPLAIGLGVAAVGLSAAVVLVATRGGDPDTRCRGFEQRLTGVWDDARRAALRTAFVATSRPYALDTFERVAGRFDAYGRAWVTARVEACQATHVRGEQSAQVLDLRMRCLDRRLDELDALVDVLGDAPDATTVDKAADASARLVDLAHCADVEALSVTVPMPDDPAVRGEIEAIEHELTRAKAMSRAGKVAEAQAIVGPLLARVSAVAYPPLDADARLYAADLAQRLETKDDYQALVYAAMTSAATARDDRLLSKAWADLGQNLARASKFAEATLALRAARAAAARGTQDLRTDLQLTGLDGTIAYQETRFDDAITAWRAGLDALRAAGLTDDPEIARLEMNIGLALRATSRFDEAREYLERSIAQRERLYGPDHPEIALALTVLSQVASDVGDDRAALPPIERAIAIYEGAFGKDHSEVANALVNYASVLQGHGRIDDALAAVERARVIWEAKDDPELAHAYNMLGSLTSSQGKLDEARAHYRKALAIRERVLPPNHEMIIDVVANLAVIELEAGDFEAARREMERALAAYRATFGDDHMSTALAIVYLGEIANAAGDHAAALQRFLEAAAIRTRLLGADNVHTGVAYAKAGEAALALGRADDALAHGERAEAAFRASPDAGENIGQAEFISARARWALRRDRPRAIALAKDALARLTSDRAAELRAQVQAWLAAHE